MKGLLYKDFRMILKDYRWFMVIASAFILMGIFWKEGLYGPVYGMFFLATVVSTLQNYDEAVGFRKYCAILPLSRADIVNEKYLLALILTAAGTGLYVLVSLVTGKWNMMFETALAMSTSGFAASALSLPFSMIFGAQKGSLVRYVFIVLMIFAGMFLISNTNDILAFLAAKKAAGLLFLLAAAAVFELSRRLSVRFYQNRDL